MFMAIVRSDVGAISDVIVKVADSPSFTVAAAAEIVRTGIGAAAGRRPEPPEVGTA